MYVHVPIFEITVNFFFDIHQDPSSPLLRSAPGFQIYLSCLISTGQQASINAAVRRRDALLASSTTIGASSPAMPEVLEPSSSVNASETATPSTPSVDSVTPFPSNSRDIAQAALSGQVEPIAGGSSSADMAKLTAALESGGGNFANPIQVSVVERQFPTK